MRTLLVEDTPDVAEAIVACFRRQGVVVDHAGMVAMAREFIAVREYDVAIVDIELPDGEGTEILRCLDPATRTLMLTVRNRVEDRIAALDGGADDYLVKPFDLRELEARVRALYRRRGEPRASVIRFGNVDFDGSGDVRIAGEPVRLTRREFSLLRIMLDNRGRVVTKQSIFERMFACDEEPESLNAVEIQIGRLRRKLGAESGVELKTLRGLGYQLVATD